MSIQVNSISQAANTKTASLSSQISQAAAVDNFGMTQIAADEFSSSMANTDAALAEVDSAINQTTDENQKQELIAKKEALLAEKKELKTKQEALTQKMNKISSEISAYKSQVTNIQNEIAQLTASKESLEKGIQSENKELASRNNSLKAVNGKIDTTSAELEDAIAELHKSVETMRKKSEDELKSQRKAVSLATTQAMALVEAGEIKPEDIPSYVAGQISGFTSVGNTAGVAAADSTNTKIKALCSELSSYVDQRGTIQLAIKASQNKVGSVSPLIESLASKIQAKNVDLKYSEGLMGSKETEMMVTRNEYDANDTRMTAIDSEVTAVDAQIEAISIPANTQQPAGEAAIPETAPQANARPTQYPQFFVSTSSVASSLISDKDLSEAMDKINAEYQQTLSQEVKNTEVDKLRAKMSEADKLITTLRTHLADNAQKIIEERLSATKRR